MTKKATPGALGSNAVLGARLLNALLYEFGSDGEVQEARLAEYAASRTATELLMLPNVGRKGLSKIRAWHTALGFPEPSARQYGVAISGLFNDLRSGPLRKQDAFNRVGSGNMQRLIKSGAILEYHDDDPGYSLGIPGKKPTCLWVKLGDVEYIPNRQREITPDRIAAAIALLESRGYVVTAPNAMVTGT